MHIRVISPPIAFAGAPGDPRTCPVLAVCFGKALSFGQNSSAGKCKLGVLRSYLNQAQRGHEVPRVRGMIFVASSVAS